MPFHHFMGSIAAFLFAAWAFVVALFVGTFGLVRTVYPVVLAHALVLGLPIFLVFWWKRWVNAITCICGGFLVAAASGTIPNWPVGPKGRYTTVGVPLVVDGVPTLAGWLDFLKVLIFLGVFGAIAGIVFWATLHATGTLAPAANGINRSQRSRAISLGVVAVLLTGTIFVIPAATWEQILRPVDQSCHNVLRDRDSISPQVSMELPIAADDVPKFMKVIEDFAATQKLSFRDSGVPPNAYVSLCNEQGVTIKLGVSIQPSRSADSSISVFELKEAARWQPMTLALLAKIETEWPGKVLFRSPQGGYMSRPKELL